MNTLSAKAISPHKSASTEACGHNRDVSCQRWVPMVAVSKDRATVSKLQPHSAGATVPFPVFSLGWTIEAILPAIKQNLFVAKWLELSPNRLK